jgi:DNA replication licensing factor MCM6
VVLDDCNPEADRQVAQHILNVHRCQEKAVQPPFTTDQMRRYIKFARTLNPKITPESQRVMVECYRKLRQGDSLGRSRSAYRITVRQLESMVRLSEALARLYCADEIQPSYVREAYRLLKTSIIQVATNDVEVDDDEDDLPGDSPAGADPDEDEEMEESPDTEPETQDKLETQERPLMNPGEYSGEETAVPKEESQKEYADVAPKAADPPKKKKKKKTKISFEEYESITNAIAGHLRALESDDETTSEYLQWDQVLEWYLSQSEHLIGDSIERLEEIRKKVNLVIRRLIDVDRILVTVGEAPKGKKDQGSTLVAVHPNYEVS